MNDIKLDHDIAIIGSVLAKMKPHTNNFCCLFCDTKIDPLNDEPYVGFERINKTYIYTIVNICPHCNAKIKYQCNGDKNEDLRWVELYSEDLLLKRYRIGNVFYIERNKNGKIISKHAFKCTSVYTTIDKTSFKNITEKSTPQLNEAIEVFCKELKKAGWTHVNNKIKLLEALNNYKELKNEKR